jgi:cell division protein FtsQ
VKAKIFKLIKFLVLTTVLISLGWATYTAAHYLRTSPRFEVHQLSVSGLTRVSENEVIERANFDLGTNAFDVNLEQMRQRIEGLQWVRYAVVRRNLPNEIRVKITERTPAGLARIDGEIYEFDEDAVILEPDKVSTPSFPILDGLQRGDSESNKRKVQLYQKVIDALGKKELSQIRIDRAGDVTIVGASDRLSVSIGAEDFNARWAKYLELKSQIERQYPEAVSVDLRFKNEVILKMHDDEPSNNKVIWDAEKKLL